MAIFNSFLYVFQRVVFSLVTSCFVRSIPRSRSERDHTMTSPFFVSDGSLHAARVSPYNIYICIYIYINYVYTYINHIFPYYPYFGIDMSQQAFSFDCLLTCFTSMGGFWDSQRPRLWRFFAATSLDNSSNNLDILWMQEILHHLGWLKP